MDQNISRNDSALSGALNLHDTQTPSRDFHIGPSTIPMFVELQELVSRVRGGLHFEEEIFSKPVAAHSRVLWLETARWLNFEQNYDEVEQRFTEAHVSPMKFTRVAQLCEELRRHCVILTSEATTLGQALDEVARHAFQQGCFSSYQQYNVLRAILFAERWHPEVKGHISDSAEFEQYWEDTYHASGNLAFQPDSGEANFVQVEKDEQERRLTHMMSVHHQSYHPYHRYNNTLTHCLDHGTEACTVLCGTVEFLEKPIVILLRLNNSVEQSCVCEVDVPVRFLFIYLGPKSTNVKYTKLARVFAVMMSNATFRSGIYRSNTMQDVLDMTDVFMDESLVMPISKYANPTALAGMVRQIEAYKKELGYDKEPDRKAATALTSKRPSHFELSNLELGARKPSALSIALVDFEDEEPSSSGQPPSTRPLPVISKKRRFVQDFCPPFISLIRGFKPWFGRMSSDYKDAFKKDNLAIVLGSVLFLYFVNLAPTITFAALLNTQVSSDFTVTLTLLSSGVFLVLFTVFGGQPLGFIGITGPIFILETSIASVAQGTGVPVSQLRFWVAIYCTIFGLLSIAFNLPVLANHVRRSVEEVFNSFIAFFFLLKALFTMFRLIPDSLADGATAAEQIAYTGQLAIAGATLFLAFVKLQFCLNMAEIKNGNYFRRFFRKLIGALNVPLGMLLIAALNLIFFQSFQLPTVNVPPSNQIDPSDWVNVPNFPNMTVYPAGTAPLVHGVGIAMGFALNIIVFTEAALNGITAMKNKAVKPNVFTMDLVLLVIIFPLLCGCLGWPFFSGATVRTMSNLVALVKLDHAPAPGMPHRVVGTVEQRVSGVIVGLLVCLSVFLGSILRFIPLAALYGMFLYMGVMGLRNLQFFQRCLALMKRRKHWEDWECVRGLPSKHILVFASIQALVVAILVILNIISEFTVASYAGIVFPVIILLYAILREAALPKWTWLSIYLHQLDRKYKLDAPTAKTPLCRTVNGTMNSSVDVYTTEVKEQYANDQFEAEEVSDYSEHQDGVVRRTWAT